MPISASRSSPSRSPRPPAGTRDPRSRRCRSPSARTGSRRARRPTRPAPSRRPPARRARSRSPCCACCGRGTPRPPCRSTSARTARGVATPIVSASTTSVPANRAASSATTPGSTGPSNGQPKATDSVTVAGRSASARIRSTRATASSSVALPLRWLKVSVAANVTFTRSSAVAASRDHPRSFSTSPASSTPSPRSIPATTSSAPAIAGTRVVADEADRLDPPQPGRGEPARQLRAHRRARARSARSGARRAARRRRSSPRPETICCCSMAGMILAGTRKGLFVLRDDGDRRSWSVEEPVLDGLGDLPRGAGPARRIAVRGRRTTRSTARPSTARPTTARRGRARRVSASPRTASSSWRRRGTSSRAATPSRAASGSAPHPASSSARTTRARAGRSTRELLNHPTREQLEPRRRRDVHALDPARPRRTRTACTSASRPQASSRSEDGGETWDAGEQGDGGGLQRPTTHYPEVGQCVHKLLLHAGPGRTPVAAEPLRRLPHRRPRRELGAARGERPAERVRLPACARPSHGRMSPSSSPRTRCTRPRSAAGTASPPTAGFGSTAPRTAARPGRSPRTGCPERAWVEVLREGMASDKEDSPGIYFGTKSGSVFVSPDTGDEWIEAAGFLPAILSVEVGEWQ